VIYVCIPAHNEERTIGVLLWKIRKVMLEFGRDYEVLVLDDASTDGTAAVLDRYRRVLPLRILKEEHHGGYAGAVQRLLWAALERTSYPKRDTAILLQADFTESPDYILL
jgi:dolichol-phosphate mannosyltransferase